MKTSSNSGRRALISVHDKTGLVELGRRLVALDFELVASGGTARALVQADLPVTPVEAVTGSPELLGGRVKTLHPVIHGAILARRTPEHLAELAAREIRPIDLVVCNLYPFAEAAARGELSEAEVLEEMDIGGVTLLRAAAKNYEAVLVACEPAGYGGLLDALGKGAGAGSGVTLAERRRLALRAMRQTAAYDTAIARWLEERAGTAEREGLAEEREQRGVEDGARPAASEALPASLELHLEQRQSLRYGENPHQQAALYVAPGAELAFEALQGKELSYNNLLDLDAAWSQVQEYVEPAVAIIKHGNPCGLAVSADSAASAFRPALECDPVSAFGSVIAVNREVDLALLEAIGKLFVEVLVAPAFAPEALQLLGKRKKMCRAVRARAGACGRDDAPAAPAPVRLRSLLGGVLAQSADCRGLDEATWRVMTERAPTAEERRDLAFAWLAVKHVKSNAIVFARGQATVGIGAGQMNRADSVFLAARRAGERARGAVMASDAFFPFADGIELAAAAGVTACIQPGGSVRDAEMIEVANRLDLAMIGTGERHFRH